MTARTRSRGALRVADAGEAADLAAFLARLIRYDRAAAARVQVAGTAMAVFGRPPSFDVLAVRTVRLARPFADGADTALDRTVSVGDLLESVDEASGTATVPDAVTGPPWAGMLPPRGGWVRQPGLPEGAALGALVSASVAEFRGRTEDLAPEERSRAALDAIGQEIWSRPVGDTPLPVRAAHAARSLGFLRPGRTPATDGAAAPREEERDATGGVALFASGPWLRLRAPYGSVAVRRAGPGTLRVTPA